MNNPVLDAREDRWNRRRAMAATLPAGWSVLSFTLRLPAPLRLGGDFDRDAEGLFRDLVFHLGSRGFPVESPSFAVRADGPEGLCAVRGDGEAVKRAVVEFEEGHPRGCLADGDLMDSLRGETGRKSLGLPPRRCLVCGRPAAECVGPAAQVADGEPGDVRTDRDDATGDVRPEDAPRGPVQAPNPGIERPAHQALPVREVHRGRRHLDEHLAGAGLGLGDLVDAQDVRRAVLVVDGGSHRG